MQVLTEIKNRGVEDVLMLVCDGLKGLPNSVATVWPATIVQTCIVHLMRNSFRYAARQDWDAIFRAFKPVYQGRDRGRGRGTLLGVPGEVGPKVPGDRAAMVHLLGFSSCRSCSSTGRFVGWCARRMRSSRSTPATATAVKARGHFPNEQAALKCVYLAVMALDPTGKGRARWTQRWKAALNAFDISFDGRLSAGRR